MWFAIPGAIAAAVVGWLTYLGTRAGAASRRDEAEITTRGEEWQKILSASQAYADRRIADQGEEITTHREKIHRLENKVGQLEQENELTRTKYWKAIFYGRAWRLRHPESVPHVEVPPEIADDL